jgi:hypothetical protein
MSKARPLMFAAAGCVAILDPGAARADHGCDQLGGPGWSTVLTHETVSVADGSPYQVAPGGDWYVDRTTTVLPLCNYINAAGNYSLLSYSLNPEDKNERVAICRDGVRVAPYTGPCPPK